MAGANAFVVEPTVAQVELPPTWTCPITQIVVPKVPEENVAWRASLLKKAEKDRGLQSALYTACSQSLLFYANFAVWTVRVFQTVEGRVQQVEQAYVPFVTWPIQDEHLLTIEDAIDNAYSVLTDKSRDMGASWNHLVAIDHQYRFRDNALFLELSRREEEVDSPGNQKALLQKHDIIYNWLPEWMRERRHRTHMHIHNLDNGSRIDGESTNQFAGSADRRRAVLLDEFSKANNATKIKTSLRDVSPCLLPNSTPAGPGTEYTKWRHSGKIKVFTLPWWKHPEKSYGVYTKQQEDGKWMIHSPWYDHECSVRSQREVAQEIDLDHLGSGALFFEPHIIEQHKTAHARKHKIKRGFHFRPNTPTERIPGILQRQDKAAARANPKGHWRIWTNLINGRPDQTKTYTFGIDISKGQGASNSVVSVLCNETREKVAEYACATKPPYELAVEVAAAALWFGGARRRLPLLIWEMNGPGWDFGRTMVKTLQYPNYFVDHAVGTASERKGKRYGWHANATKKEQCLGIYRRALAHGGIINHSAEALDETLEYVYLDTGGIGPATLQEESASARKTHGDRVIADMLCLLGVEEAPKPVAEAPSAPIRSFAYRFQQNRKKRREAARQRTFDFSRGV